MVELPLTKTGNATRDASGLATHTHGETSREVPSGDVSVWKSTTPASTSVMLGTSDGRCSSPSCSSVPGAAAADCGLYPQQLHSSLFVLLVSSQKGPGPGLGAGALLMPARLPGVILASRGSVHAAGGPAGKFCWSPPHVSFGDDPVKSKNRWPASDGGGFGPGSMAASQGSRQPAPGGRLARPQRRPLRESGLPSSTGAGSVQCPKSKICKDSEMPRGAADARPVRQKPVVSFSHHASCRLRTQWVTRAQSGVL